MSTDPSEFRSEHRLGPTYACCPEEIEMEQSITKCNRILTQLQTFSKMKPYLELVVNYSINRRLFALIMRLRYTPPS